MPIARSKVQAYFSRKFRIVQMGGARAGHKVKETMEAYAQKIAGVGYRRMEQLGKKFGLS